MPQGVGDLRQDVVATIARLKRESVAVLLVEQNVELALGIADRAYVMHGGRIIHESSAAALRADRTLQRRLLGI